MAINLFEDVINEDVLNSLSISELQLLEKIFAGGKVIENLLFMALGSLVTIVSISIAIWMEFRK